VRVAQTAHADNRDSLGDEQERERDGGRAGEDLGAVGAAEPLVAR
jgi:hypothetical protein